MKIHDRDKRCWSRSEKRSKLDSTTQETTLPALLPPSTLRVGCHDSCTPAGATAVLGGSRQGPTDGVGTCDLLRSFLTSLCVSRLQGTPHFRKQDSYRQKESTHFSHRGCAVLGAPTLPEEQGAGDVHVSVGERMGVCMPL